METLEIKKIKINEKEKHYSIQETNMKVVNPMIP